MNLSSLFEQRHKGRQNRIKRRELLALLRREVNPILTDREMRKMYEKLALCGDGGLFLPASEEEKQKQIRLLNEKIDRCKEEIERLVKYPINGQGRLFDD